VAKKIPIHPKHPERICWGCDRYCRVNSLACGNGTERTPHPVELFGEDWLAWGFDVPVEAQQAWTTCKHLSD
jgi:Protein of unknown function (DUF3079)